jgi:hypothetical protein
MTRRIIHFEAGGGPALGFDTGLDPRSFAQAKLARFITEPGLIVSPGGGVETWKASGVLEYSGGMVIWGPPFAGERLDILINDRSRRDEALASVGHWLRARLFPACPPAPLYPHSALIAGAAAGPYPEGTVFFAPGELTLRCVRAEGENALLSDGERYVHPGLSGPAAGAFCAAAMLYHILAGTAPFPAADESLLCQDMREGNFLPCRLAAFGLDENLAALMEEALRPAGPPRADLAPKLLETLRAAGPKPGAASFFRPLPSSARASLEKEKARAAKRKNITVKTRRFVIRNTAIIIGCAAALLAAFLTAGSLVKSHAELPTTRGMSSEQVIASYYRAFGELDHAMMDACVIKGAGKNDIDMVLNLFVIGKIRQAYEWDAAPALLSAEEWKSRGALPAEARVFGVTDLRIDPLSGGEEADEIRRRARYTLWLPYQDEDGGETPALPRGVAYADELTLIRNRGNWRISAIRRGPD